MEETKRVRDVEVLRQVGSDEIGLYCHACGEMFGHGNDWDFITPELLDDLAERHEFFCEGNVQGVDA